MNFLCHSVPPFKPTGWEWRQSGRGDHFQRLEFEGAAASQSGTSVFSFAFPSPQVALLYPFVNPAVEEPLQINLSQHYHHPLRRVCSVKLSEEIQIFLEQEKKEGLSLLFKIITSAALYMMENSPYISQWILRCQGPRSHWLTETSFQCQEYLMLKCRRR